jgi:hypothetical protein
LLSIEASLFINLNRNALHGGIASRVKRVCGNMNSVESLVPRVLSIIEEIENKLKQKQDVAHGVRANLAAVLGAILNWSQSCGIKDSGEVKLGNGLTASRVDFLAIEGAKNALETLSVQQKHVTYRLMLETLQKSKDPYQDTPKGELFGQGKTQVTVLLDPIDGTRNLRDGRIFNTASVAAASNPLTSNKQPTFGDITTACTCFLSTDSNFRIVIEGVLASPTHIWKFQINPSFGELELIEPFNPEPRKFREIVFSSYYAPNLKLTQLEIKLIEAGYLVVPGCGASALDCLRVLRLEQGAYIDFRAFDPNSRSKLHTYDIVSIPFTATILSKITNDTINVYSANLGKQHVKTENVYKLPLYPAPLSFMLTKNMNEKELFSYLDQY